MKYFQRSNIKNKVFLNVILETLAFVLIIFQNLTFICCCNTAVIVLQSEISCHVEFLPNWFKEVIPEHPHILQLLLPTLMIYISKYKTVKVKLVMKNLTINRDAKVF